MKRLITLCIMSFLTGCSPNFKGDDAADLDLIDTGGTKPNDGDDSGTTPPEPGECDDTPSTIICVDGDAITCDSEGDIEASQSCAEGRETCIDDLGCSACGIDLNVLHLPFGIESAFIGTRAEVTADNVAIERLHSRPVEVDIVDPERTQGQIALTLTGDGFQIWVETDAGPVFADTDGVLLHG